MSGTITQVDNIIISATGGSAINTSYLSGCNCTLSSAVDCLNVCEGETLLDACGECAGDGSTCTDCAGTLNGDAIICGVSGSFNMDLKDSAKNPVKQAYVAAKAMDLYKDMADA